MDRQLLLKKVAWAGEDMKRLAKFGLAAIAIIAVIVACAVSYEVGKSSNINNRSGLAFTPIKGNWGSSNVPIRTCASSYGVSTMQSKRAPKSLRETPATSASSELSFYSDAKHNLTPILGPAGWKCSASEGADGTSTISIYPPGVSDPSGTANGTEETMGVEETMLPACQGCIADLECPVFLNAENQLGYNGQYCPGYVPPSESVRFLEGNAESDYGVAILSDPSGSPGTVTLSGGDYPAIGALLYLRVGASGSDATGGSIGCVLPSRYDTLCKAVVNNFVWTFSKISY